jgi:hypothetical protein
LLLVIIKFSQNGGEESIILKIHVVDCLVTVDFSFDFFMSVECLCNLFYYHHEDLQYLIIQITLLPLRNGDASKSLSESHTHPGTIYYQSAIITTSPININPATNHQIGSKSGSRTERVDRNKKYKNQAKSN